MQAADRTAGGARHAHAVITRFSYRGAFGPLRAGRDPLDPSTLERRFAVFQATCLPSLLGQTTRNFLWVLLVDTALPATFRQRLERLVSDHPDARLVSFSKRLNLQSLDWLAPHMAPHEGHLTTTTLDDDDLLHAGYVQAVDAHVDELRSRNALAPLLLLGCARTLQWDLAASRNAAFGHVKPWKPGTTDEPYPPSAGLSLVSRYPDTNHSVFAFRHDLAPWYFDAQASQRDLSSHLRAHIEKTRAAVGWTAERARDGASAPAEYHWLSGEALQALVTNHGANLQPIRLLMGRRQRRKVDGPNDLPGFPVDFAAASQCLAQHSIAWRELLKELVWQELARARRGSIVRGVWRRIRNTGKRRRA
jgi:hypothetical protein